MPTRIDNFETLYQLGSGFSAVTKLAVDDDGNQVALKIFDLENQSISANSLALLKTEFEATKDFAHENIVRYMAFNDNTQEIKENGSKKKIAYLAMEAVKGGELFDYIANSGAFSPKFSRHYFKQMLKAIHYIHSQGNAHRDLKPENILLDSDYNVKIIDFGFTCNITGRQGTGYNQTGVGTPGYMAPEILRKDPYSSQGVDIFALGVILFIMYAGHPPFSIAKEDDMFYKLLASGRADLFWKAHSNKKAEGFFSDDFKDLITSMLQVQPYMRLSLADVVGHPWMQAEYPSPAEIQAEFTRRHQVNKDRSHDEEEKKAALEAKIKERNANNRRQVDGTTYLAADDGEAADTLSDDIKKLTLQKYNKDKVNGNLCFFSNLPAEELLQQITAYLKAEEQQYKISDKNFKITFDTKRQLNIPTPEYDDEDEQEEKKVEHEDPIFESTSAQVQLLNVDGQNKICVDFKRKAGSAIFFYDTVKKLKGDIQLCNNTTLE